MTEKRTDLALEARESFPRNHVEIQGVVLEKKKCLQGKVKITTVIIRDEAGSKAMEKTKRNLYYNRITTYASWGY